MDLHTCLGNCKLKLPTWPSLSLTSHLGQNVGLGEGKVGSFPDNDLLSSNKTESYTFNIISKGDKQTIKLLRVRQHFLEQNANHYLSSDAQNLFAIKEIIAHLKW